MFEDTTSHVSACDSAAFINIYQNKTCVCPRKSRYDAAEKRYFVQQKKMKWSNDKETKYQLHFHFNKMKQINLKHRFYLELWAKRTYTVSDLDFPFLWTFCCHLTFQKQKPMNVYWPLGNSIIMSIVHPSVFDKQVSLAPSTSSYQLRRFFWWFFL